MEPEPSPSAALAAVAAGAVILDVRRVDEHEKRHIAGAVNIPLVELTAAIEAPSPLLVSEDGTKKNIVVHCATGARSATAAGQLVAAGFSVVDIGPMDDWQGEGLPPRAEISKQVKCDGCGKVMPEGDFQAHCANEVDLHDDDFMYTYTVVEAVPVVATEQAGGAVKLDFAATEGPWSHLPCVPLDPPNPCRNWMEKWSTPCERLCCHTHPSECPCADISCDGCGYSIVRPDGATTASMNGLEPMDRYVCLECPVDADYDSEHWSHQLCDSCFASCVTAPHLGKDGTTWHTQWLRVSPAGEHSIVQRVTEGIDLLEVGPSDLMTDDVPGVCLACMENYTEGNNRASPPGCTIEAHRLYCTECTMEVLLTSKRHLYVRRDDGSLPPSTFFCVLCENDSRKRLETERVLRELKVLLESGAELSVAVQQLKSAHALKPGTEVNLHLHEALDAYVASEAAC